MDLYLQLPIDKKGNKFIISNEKTKLIDDDQVYLILIIDNKKVFSFKDSFAFEIGDIIYRWLNEEDSAIIYNGTDFLTDFIVSEEKWDKEIPLEIKMKEKSEFSKFWLFSSKNIDIFSFSNSDGRNLLITENISKKSECQIIYQTVISKDEILQWRKIFEQTYLDRLERERKIISNK